MTDFDLHDPSTGDVFDTIELADIERTDAAIDAATRAQVGWAALAPADRGRLLGRFAAVVDAHVEELAQLEVRGAGHTVGNARWEAGNVRDVLQYYAAAPERLLGSQIPVAGGLDVTFREPLGVVGVIVPWNFPMPVAGWGFAPALAAGNAVVVKPAEITPLTAVQIGELALEAGLPPGVLQIVPGAGPVVGKRFVTHPGVAKVCFTGSTAVGKEIMRGAADTLTRVTLELGGKNANIVFGDADIELAARQAPMAVFDNAGQDCCARSRILVQRNVFDEFLDHFEKTVGDVVVADPRGEDTQMGPLVSQAQLDRVRSYVEGDGVEVAFRGRTPDDARLSGGYWYPPTVVLATDSSARLWREEVFGPVVAVLAFDDEADAVAKANDTAYGLAGSIWTRDVGRALRVSRAVRAGNLSVNSNSAVRYATPFGGMKASGIGRELGPDALDAFTDVKNVFISSE